MYIMCCGGTVWPILKLSCISPHKLLLSGLEWIPDYPNNYPRTESGCFFVSRYSFDVCICAEIKHVKSKLQ